MIPKSKGLTRQDPYLIPTPVGITGNGARDLFGINPETFSGLVRDLVRIPGNPEQCVVCGRSLTPQMIARRTRLSAQKR